MRLLAILVLLAPAWAQSAVYKWVDDDGNVHYSDMPPAQHAETLNVDSSVAHPADTPPVDADQQVEKALRIVSDSRERREALEREERAAEQEAAERKRECDRIAGMKRQLEGGGFIYRKDDPTMAALSDEELAAEIEKLERALAANCAERASESR